MASMTLAPTRTRVARQLVIGMVALVVTDLAGGVLAIAAGVNTPTEAWGSRALLAAPAPMIAVQMLFTWLSVRRDRCWAALPAGLLSTACLVSVVSGFFDGGLGNDHLSGPLVGVQVLLLTVTGLVGLLAAARARELLRRR